MYETKEKLVMALMGCIPYPEQIKNLDCSTDGNIVSFDWRGMNGVNVSLCGSVAIIVSGIETRGHDTLLLEALLRSHYTKNV
jgi:hypothetical protein